MVWVVSPNKVLHRHLFDLVSTGGDSTSENMRRLIHYFDDTISQLYFDKYANVVGQYARLFRQFKREVR